jgi:hypothetical protein
LFVENDWTVFRALIQQIFVESALFENYYEWEARLTGPLWLKTAVLKSKGGPALYFYKITQNREIFLQSGT